ncbi:surface carbohydrate biosynthesis protein [Nisaea denitrificans]|uniref:surface carbohydrate biosynthesis protein n=1 Tax=Nisaea denitrificans TaxID=390877 RepID=UPI0004266DA6|nr:surface carbohydrate biosynthesis protein [Nisaea denitrificans]
MSKSYKHLYLPIEEAARELDARLLLVMAAMQKGYRVVIGQQWLMVNNLPNLAPGIVFFKGTNKVQSVWMSHANKHGHKIVAIDEEVTAIADRKFVLKEVSLEALPLIDRFFLQGQNQYDIYADAFPDFQDRFTITGNPRFDLLRKEFTKAFDEDAQAYRTRYGRYILINTNFGYVNTAWGKPENFVKVCENVGYANRSDPEDRKFFDDFYDLEVMNMAAFKVMTRKLRDRFPDHQIVLRPHPAEDVKSWTDALSGEERIHVVFEGSAVPWMLGADYFIHNTCTTGTEAMVLGVPVGAYAFYTNWVESIFLSNLVTPVFRDMDSLFDAVEAGIRDREGAIRAIRQDRDQILRQHISGLDQKLATAGIFHGIDTLEVARSAGSVFRDGRGLRVAVNRSQYQRKKIDLDIKQLNQKVTNLVKATGIGFSAKAEKIGDSLFVFTPVD